MPKKNIVYVTLTTIAFLVISTSSGVANAYPQKIIGLNLGAELSLLNTPSINERLIGANGFKKNKLGANFFIGWRFNENFGVELGYGFITKNRESGQNNANHIVDVTHKVRNMHIDALGYAPINPCVDLIGSIGIGRFKSKLGMPSPNVNDTAFISAANKAKIGLRVGIGAQYNFCNNWSSRVMVRYQKGNKNFFKNNVSIAAGLSYSFT